MKKIDTTIRKFGVRVVQKIFSEKRAGAIGDQISLLRRALRMSQVQLARRCAMTQVSISHIEENKGNPTLKSLEKIAQALHCVLQIKLFPKGDLEEFIRSEAQSRAKALVALSFQEAVLENQKPSEEEVKKLVEILVEDLLHKPNDIWEA